MTFGGTNSIYCSIPPNVLAEVDGFSVTLRSWVTMRRASLELVRTSALLTSRIVCSDCSPDWDDL
jgi:hypothetical protein